MSRSAAILGLGWRGEGWAGLCLQAGWRVCAFDPAPSAASAVVRLPGLDRRDTISSAVRGADWIVCSVPDRLELIQKVVQRAQAEAPENAIIAIASRDHDVETLQSCAVRPAQVVRLIDPTAGGVALDVSERNTADLKRLAKLLSAELAAIRSLRVGSAPEGYESDTESA